MGRFAGQLDGREIAGAAPGVRLSVAERVIAGHAQDIPLRLYRPLALAAAGAPVLPAVLWFHGGGFTTGSLDEAEAAAAAVAEGVPALVVSVGYSLAPAFPFPAAIEDARRTACWVAGEAGSLGVRRTGIGVAGHDAGAHIAAALTLIARDQGHPFIAGQALLAPMLDPSLTRIAEERDGQEDLRKAYGETVRECGRCFRAYLPVATQRLHPYAALLDCRRLDRLPPALIVTAGNDPLRRESERYACRLAEAGVAAQVLRFADASRAGLARHAGALSAASQFLRRRLTGAEP